MWTSKYKPEKIDEFIGNRKALDELSKYSWKKPLLIYGPPGVGKTALVEAIAIEHNLELVEITDRNRADAITSSQTKSLMGKRKLIYIDNVERADDMKQVSNLLKKTRSPVILVTSDFTSRRLASIKKSCEKINIRKPTTASITKLLDEICIKEKIKADKETLKKIAENSAGDIRSALIDLQTISLGKSIITEEDLHVLDPRDRATDIYKVLAKILVKKDFNEAIKSSWNLDLQPKDLILWIDENMPRTYLDKNDLVNAIQYISRADMFIGRIMRRQYWGFLRYASPLMTGGVNASRAGKIKFSYFQFPSYIIKMSQTKKDRGMKKNIGVKLSKDLHASTKLIAEQYIPLYKILLKSGKVTEKELEEEYMLDGEELDYLAQ